MAKHKQGGMGYRREEEKERLLGSGLDCDLVLDLVFVLFLFPQIADFFVSVS